MEYRVLGPLEALDEGRSIALGGPKQRSLLALLLFARGRPVSSERLIDEIWGGQAPETAQKSVQVYVSGLRKALGEERILTRERGYAFVLEPGELDLDRFDLLVREAAAEPAEHAVETLRSALALFRGQPLEDLALERWAEPEIARIEELRLLALEKRVDADLEVGRHRDVAPELETLVADHPYREHLLEQLMLALYRSGRQADALESYRRGAARLRDVLGLEPGRALQELEQRILRHDTSLDPLPAGRATTSTSARRRHGWRFVAVGGAIVLVAAVAAAVVALTRTTQASLTGLAPGVATLDARTGRLLSSIPTSEISKPVEAVVGSGSFWVWGLSPFSLTRINPENGKILIRIASPFGSDAGWYLPNGNSVWFVGNHDLVRVDAHTGLETNRYRLVTSTHTFGLVGIARGDGSLWLASNEENQLLRVDPATGRILHTISIPSPWAVAYGDGAVWVTSNVVGLVRVDPATNTISATAAIPQPVNNVAVGGGFAWATNETKGTVYKVNQQGTIGATYQTGDGARGVSFADGKLWVVNQDVGSVTAIDPATGGERNFRFGHPLNAVAALGTRLAVVINPGRTYEDRITALKGKVARLIVPIYQFDPPDPPLAYNPFVFQAEQATCASLLRYPDAAPPEGFRLEPELATAMPTVSPDGRTYTFRMRSGYRFAPPSNAPVTAATIRYGIERALSPRLNDDLPGAQYLFDLNGVAKFRAGETTHIAGIHTNGNQIALTLTAPSPDFLERLSLPFFCPVPLETPIVHAGLPELAPPSAGPYTMDQRFNGEYMILTRNPNYQGPRSHALDAIAFREGIDDENAVGRVEKQTWEGVSVYNNGGVLDPSGAVSKRWGPGSRAARQGDERYHATPLRQLDYLVLNSHRPLFRSPRVRRAVAAAFDRRAIAQQSGLVPTGQLLPPGVRGYRPAHQEQPATAASGTVIPNGATATMAVQSNCDTCHQTALTVVTALASLGITVITRDVPDSGATLQNDSSTFDIVDWGTALPYPDPASFLRQMFLHDIPADWLPAETTDAAHNLDRLSGTARDTAAIHLAHRLQIHDTPIIAYGYPTIGTLLTPRLGCRIWTEDKAGIDLASLCLR